MRDINADHCLAGVRSAGKPTAHKQGGSAPSGKRGGKPGGKSGGKPGGKSGGKSGGKAGGKADGKAGGKAADRKRGSKSSSGLCFSHTFSIMKFLKN